MKIRYYEDKTLQQNRDLTRQYFISLVKDFDLELKLDFKK